MCLWELFLLRLLKRNMLDKNKFNYFTEFAFIFNPVSMNSRNALFQEILCLRKLK